MTRRENTLCPRSDEVTFTLSMLYVHINRYFVLAVVVVPVLFYVPKFFEVRSQEVVIPYQVTINCTDYVRFRGSNAGFQGLAQQSMVNFRSSLFPQECSRLPFR